MKKILILMIALAVALAAVPVISFAEGEEIFEFRYAMEYVYADGRMVTRCDNVNGDTAYTFTDEIVFSEWLSLGGWMANEEGIKKLQFSVDGGETWQDTDNPNLFYRGDLAPAGIPYQNGHKTAGFGPGKNTIPASGITEDHCSVLVRALTLNDNYVIFWEFADVTVVASEEGVDDVVYYNTYIDDLTRGTIRNPRGVSEPAEAMVELKQGQTFSMRGWAASSVGISNVVYQIDDGEFYDVVGPFVSRPDVMDQYPIYTAEQGNTNHVGFGKPGDFVELQEVAKLGGGFYDVHIYGVSADGNKKYEIITIELYVEGEPTPTPEVTEPPAATEPPEEPTEEPDVEEPTESPDDGGSGDDGSTEPSEPTEKPAGKKGCGSALGLGSIFAVTVLAALFIKRKEN